MQASKPFVLVVDDQPEIRKLVGLTLSGFSCDVREAGSSVEAIDMLGRRVPALVVLDLMMPDPTDGLEVLRWIRASELHAGTRVVVASALGFRGEVGLAMKMGADAYLVKPFSPTRLQELVRKWI